MTQPNKLLIFVDQVQREPNYRAWTKLDGKTLRSTSTCGLESAAQNLAARILVGPKCGYAGYQLIDLVQVCAAAVGPAHVTVYEASLKQS